jgi:hypothetical protein
MIRMAPVFTGPPICGPGSGRPAARIRARIQGFAPIIDAGERAKGHEGTLPQLDFSQEDR